MVFLGQTGGFATFDFAVPCGASCLFFDQRLIIPNIRNNVGFGYVSSATNFSSSLVPCHAGNGHSFQTKNLCSFLAKPNVISDIWYNKFFAVILQKTRVLISFLL